MPKILHGKFVVLGGASQIGSHIGEQLLSGGAKQVILLDNLSLGRADVLEPLLQDSRCTLVRGDVLRLNELFDPLAGADGVFAVAGIMASTIGERPWLSIDVNVRGLQNALEACRYQGVKKLIFSSSVGLYGIMEDEPTDEESPYRWQLAPSPSMIYGASKILGEALARYYQERYHIGFVALRYPSVYGARQHQRAVMGGHIATTCERIRNGQPPIIDGDGLQVSDYIYVGDVARANLMAMESELTNESLNICSGVATSQKRIVDIALQACGSELEPEYRPFKVTRLPATTKVNISRTKAKRLLDWDPQVSIEEGVFKVLQWIDESRGVGAKRP